MNITQALLESLPEPYCVLSLEAELLGANTAFLELLQVSTDELSSRGVAAFWPAVQESCQVSGEQTVELIGTGGRCVIARVSCDTSDCVVVRVLASSVPGEAIQLHHKQRIETLGILAGGVAHDFNNVLTGILGHVAYLRHVLPKAHQAFESVGAIEEGALRAAGLTQQILNFSRLEASEQLTRVDVSAALSGVSVLLRSALPAKISLRINSSERPFIVLASEVHVAQILINLIINARDAIPDRGEIEVTLLPEIDEAEVLSLFGSEPAASHYGIIQVRDTGTGMSEHVKARLFEPYFTTKGAAGTGIGLATVNSIVKQLGGRVLVDSELDKGTLFQIVLPLREDEVLDQEKTESVEASGGGERILVIDDEDAVRNVLGLSLAHLGYQVDTAASGREGLEKFRVANGTISLVILDLLMPGLSGEDVFYRLQEMDPCVRVLIVSGFSSAHVVERILGDGGLDFIQKPFSIEVLSEKVRGCLRD